ncbi:MAG: cupin domain-containing protein [candidate division Zixibacteria bacterium]|jgi:quercetin dioxygenase-like cupin family protein|nr:cupin domain-containing protein [candidate division Zixibacteria bacterium]
MNQNTRDEKNDYSNPRKLAGLVEYAEGAVVSRTIVKNDAGTITLFSFADGQGLSEHSAPFDAYVEILDGKADITIGGKKVAVSAGDFLIMPANIPHAVQSVTKFKMLLVMIKG